jgi:NADH-quinone oxidoreductase subunit C
MKTAPEILEALKKQFADKILKSDLTVPDPWISVSPEAIREVGQFLKAAPGLSFNTLMCLSGVDYQGLKGEPDRLEVVYHLFSMIFRHKLVLKVELPREQPRLPSVETVWGIANWHEREAFDMFGIHFEGHSDLRRILCPDDWEGYPLRKDYVQPQTYLGMPVAPTKQFAEMAQEGREIGTDPYTGEPWREGH